jgi:peptidoglycan/LPS O-acetylase OafA/YrhL
MSWVGTEKILWTNGIYESFVLLFFFPLIVSIAAGSEINKDSFLFKINKFLGDISYPLYMVHYPLVYSQNSWVTNNKNIYKSIEIHFFVSFSILIMAIFIAYSSLKLFDEPIREWLRKKLFNIEKKDYSNLKNEENERDNSKEIKK